MVKIPEVKEQIKIPEKVKCSFENNLLVVKGEKGELKREFNHPKISIKIKNMAPI